MPFIQTIQPQFRDADPDGLIGLKGAMRYFQDIHTWFMHSIHKGNDELPERYGSAWVYTRYLVTLVQKIDYTDSITLEAWMEPYDYRSWKGYDPDWRLDWELSLSDKQIQDILSRKQIWHQSHGMQQIHFPNMKTENGVFSLWEVSLGPEPTDKNIISIFINEQGLYRPAASRLIWEELLKPECALEAGDVVPVAPEFWLSLEQRAQEIATDSFLQMQDAYQQRHEQQYKKQQRALTLRIEAAERIGIENIRASRIARLETALKEATDDYERHQEICPTFAPVVAFMTR